MPGGVVFLVCIPTLSYEHELVFGIPVKISKKDEVVSRSGQSAKVDLRLKEVKNRTHLITLDDGDSEDEVDPPVATAVSDDEAVERARKRLRSRGPFAATGAAANRGKSPVFVPMETASIST